MLEIERVKIKKRDDEEFTEDIYNKESRVSFVEDGEISPEEDAFMEGYDEADH